MDVLVVDDDQDIRELLVDLLLELELTVSPRPTATRRFALCRASPIAIGLS